MGHPQEDVLVSYPVTHVAEQEATSFSVDVHGPECTGGQSASVSEQLTVGRQGSPLCLFLSLAVGELQGAVVEGVLIAIDDRLALRVWPHHFDAAGINEGDHVLLDTRLQEDLGPCEANNKKLASVICLIHGKE